ncbi:UbiE/COQ5 methyltransferase [Martensiomyces pterosporus]|nr:UbiE/COQ5 methyltransferase [Martensiomyces pterosporus]
MEPLTSSRNNAGHESTSANSKAEIMNDAYWKVAEEYKRLSNIMTLGGHARWKSAFVKKMAPSPGERLLDVAGGTCEIAMHYLKYQDSVNKDRMSTVHVVDFNPGMLSVGKRRLADTQWMRDGRVTFAQGDAENLVDIPDNSFDAYTISFGMHNLENRDKALAEAYRVLKPGGRFACLESGHASSPIVRSFLDWHCYKFNPFVVRLLTNSLASYEQIAKSAKSFPHQREFVKTIRSAGFYCHGQGYEKVRPGIAVAFFGIKPKYALRKA